MNGLKTTTAGRNYRLTRPQYGWLYIFRIKGYDVIFRFLKENANGQYIMQVDGERQRTMSPARFSYLHRFNLIEERPPRLEPTARAKECADDQSEEREEQSAEEIRAMIRPLLMLTPGKEKRIEELIGESAADLYWEIEALLDLEELHGKDKLARVCVFRKFARISSLI